MSLIVLISSKSWSCRLLWSAKKDRSVRACVFRCCIHSFRLMLYPVHLGGTCSSPAASGILLSTCRSRPSAGGGRPESGARNTTSSCRLCTAGCRFCGSCCWSTGCVWWCSSSHLEPSGRRGSALWERTGRKLRNTRQLKPPKNRLLCNMLLHCNLHTGPLNGSVWHFGQHNCFTFQQLKKCCIISWELSSSCKPVCVCVFYQTIKLWPGEVVNLLDFEAPSMAALERQGD